jgi:hypothetical protein
MAQLTDIKIADDEASAFFGGGVRDGQVIEALWKEGFVTSYLLGTLSIEFPV